MCVFVVLNIIDTSIDYVHFVILLQILCLGHSWKMSGV